MTRSPGEGVAPSRWPRALLLLAAAGAAPAARAMDPAEALHFGAEMALQGNWREAKFRWERAALERPDDPKLLNNLAVAHEVLGEVDLARARYAAAFAASGGDRSIGENQLRFRLCWETGPGGEGALAPLPAGAEEKRLKGKTASAAIQVPVPPRLKLAGNESLLVASFRADDTGLLDVNRELGRFLRGEFHKRTVLRVLDVTPPPAIPEQTVEDLLANHEFWKHLGQSYSADLIVSGVVTFDRDDASTFKDVDVISPETGQKVRTSRFVEQELFRYELDVFFIDGASGELRFRDRLQQSVIFQGTQNDPIAAFYDMGESLAGDVIAVVAPRSRQEQRIVFKR